MKAWRQQQWFPFSGVWGDNDRLIVNNMMKCVEWIDEDLVLSWWHNNSMMKTFYIWFLSSSMSNLMERMRKMLGIMKLGQTGWFDVHMDNVEFVDRINMNVQIEWWQDNDAIVDTFHHSWAWISSLLSYCGILWIVWTWRKVSTGSRSGFAFYISH